MCAYTSRVYVRMCAFLTVCSSVLITEKVPTNPTTISPTPFLPPQAGQRSKDGTIVLLVVAEPHR